MKTYMIEMCSCGVQLGQGSDHYTGEPGHILKPIEVAPRPKTLAELEPVVAAAAEAMDDLLTMLGVDPKETPDGEAGNDYRTVAQVLAGAAVRGALDKMFDVDGEKP